MSQTLPTLPQGGQFTHETYLAVKTALEERLVADPAAVLALLSQNGTIMFSLDGDQVRADLNTTLDVPGGLQSVNGAAQLYYTKQQIDDLLTAFAGNGGGVTDPAASILALPGLSEWFRPAAGITTISAGADAWMGAKGGVINAPSAVQRPVPYATGGANNRPYLGFVPGAGCVLTGTVNMPSSSTREFYAYIVMKEDSGSSYPFCLIGAYGEEFVVRYKGQGYVGTTLKHDGGESNAEIQVTAGGWVIIRATGYLSEPAGSQVGIEGNGVAGVVQGDPEAGNAYTTALDFRLGAINPGGALALTGGIADVLLFTGKEGAPAKTLVTDYLKTKYNL